MRFVQCGVHHVQIVTKRSSIQLNTRLTLRELFPGSDQKDVFVLNKKCKIDFKILPMYQADSETIDLLKRLLDQNPSTRISAKQALEHPYFKERSENQSVEKKSNFQAQKKLKEQVKPLWNTTNFDNTMKEIQVQQRFEGIFDAIMEFLKIWTWTMFQRKFQRSRRFLR